MAQNFTESFSTDKTSAGGAPEQSSFRLVTFGSLAFLFTALLLLVPLRTYSSFASRGLSMKVGESDALEGVNSPLLTRRGANSSMLSDAQKALLKSPEFKVPTFPRAIYQTTDIANLPAKLTLNFEKYAKGWDRIIFNDSMAIAFLNEHFQPQVTSLFRALKVGAHKADLFRYAVLYILGGVYLDIKTELLAPLDWLFQDKTSIFLVISHISQGVIYNGIIAAPSQQPIFLDMLHYMVERGDPWEPGTYFYNIKVLHEYVAASCESTWTWSPANCIGAQTCAFDGMRFRFAQEEQRAPVQCPDGPDRYGHCAFITEHCEKIFKERYSDYPWV